jgi:hypothetical protein
MLGLSKQQFRLVQELGDGPWVPDVPVTLELDSNLDSFLPPNISEYNLFTL